MSADLSNVTLGCGTTAGYQRHRKRGEEPCQFCRDAQAAYTREYRRDPEKRAANRQIVRAQNRALWRLAHEYPEKFRAYTAEEIREARP